MNEDSNLKETNKKLMEHFEKITKMKFLPDSKNNVDRIIVIEVVSESIIRAFRTVETMFDFF